MYAPTPLKNAAIVPFPRPAAPPRRRPACYNTAMLGLKVHPRLRLFRLPLLLAAGVLLCLAALSCIPAAASLVEPPAPAQDLPPELARVVEAYNILLDEHIDHDSLTPEQLSEGAIRGLLTALDDPYASYLSADEYASEQEDYRGFFEGIGAQVTLTDAGLTVIAPIPGAPAEAAGILPGDIILEVDGVDIANHTLIEAVNLIRGPRDTAVTLLIRHADRAAADTETITITRGEIPINSVRFRMLDDRTGHLWIYGFSNTTEREVRAALDELAAAGGDRLALDLRNNPGGLLHVVVAVTDLFLDGGEILYEVDVQANRTNHSAKSGGPGIAIPMVVLVNEYSASASEILAGALQVNGRAHIAGAPTFGKGSVNISRLLSDGSAIYFSIRRWYLPDGTQIEGQGVTPDTLIEAEVQPLPMEPSDDAVLQQALSILERQTEPR